MSCYACRFYTGESFLPCTINAEVAQTSPNVGCWEFEKDPNPWGFWESPLLNPPHVGDEQIGCVPIDGLSCELVLSCELPLHRVIKDRVLREALAFLNTSFPGWKLYDDVLLSPIVTPRERVEIEDLIAKMLYSETSFSNKLFCQYFDTRYQIGCYDGVWFCKIVLLT